MTQEDLIANIRDVFPPGQQLEPDEITTCPCDECFDLKVAFAHSRWTEIADAVIDEHHGDLPLLFPLAFRQFLPAYMIRGLRLPDTDWGAPNDVLEFTTYSLVPSEMGPWWHRRVDPLDARQSLAIAAFLAETSRRELACGYEPYDPEVMEFWRLRAHA